MKFQRKALAIAVMVATSTLSACSSDDIKELLNLAPTDIKLSNVSVDENAKGTKIADLSVVDLDLKDSFTYTTNNENFVISGATLSLAPEYALDYEKETSVTFDITVTDSDNNSLTQAFTIEVNDMLDYYGFMSKVGDETKSSVSYGGQSARHALIAELKHYIGKGGLQADLDDSTLTTKADVIAKLNSLYNADELSWDNLAITFTTAKQKLFNELSGSYKSLKEKVAGQDTGGQHKDWSTEFAGWGAKGSTTPVDLIDTYFQQIADIAIDNLGSERFDPITSTKIPVYVTDNGTDLNQLIQKFLLMSVTYSQATDDYLDEEKGLATDNVSGDKEGTKDYTKLEHQFDEGFGYFGAARDYLAYNDNEIAGKVSSDEDGRSDWNGQHDTDGDGVIDLTSEKNFGNSINAAKRDRGSKDNAAATDYTKQAMDAFLMGRKLINDNAGMALTEAQMNELLGYRDTAVKAWENAVAGTVVHYINDLHGDLDKVGTADFSFSDTAKHFSELKGFALGLQFNPYSPMTDAQFEAMHVLLKDAPVLVGAVAIEAYQADLIKARDILEAALSFDTENVANW
ncbi:DUF4856 domain-containing protein [Colwellia psychrerythraea]|uniref:DUF4856 domain-containing protein n=1 Tax=Colwellia psychrerythraea TaxID=28229 RepID=A0A099KFT2_COLPS|nr:DUF4856 domain-containing protein [Colwellia psychrerythraea]KGJ89120.1 hypothetical protein GAB14E_4116 [Colwellia psychrerythraea]